MLSQNAVLRVGLTACSNEVIILKKGNEAVHKECLKMAEQSVKFEETHLKTSLLIDNHVRHCAEDQMMIDEFE